MTVYVYDKPVYDIEEGELARLTIQKAPQAGERWYVTARDGADGLILTSGAQWPEGVPEVTEGGGFWAPSGSQVLVVFLALPLLVLAAVCVATLDKLEPRRDGGRLSGPEGGPGCVDLDGDLLLRLRVPWPLGPGRGAHRLGRDPAAGRGGRRVVGRTGSSCAGGKTVLSWRQIERNEVRP